MTSRSWWWSSALVLLILGALLVAQGSEASPVKKRKQHGDLNHRTHVKAGDQPIVYGQPEQVHLSLGATYDQIMVTWVTQGNGTNDSVVEYGTRSLDMIAKGQNFLFKDGGPEHRVITIHRVLLTNLKPDTQYRYHCGSPDFGWSPLFFFTTLPAGDDWAPRFAVYGDMGNVNAQSMARLQEDVIQGMYDVILHVGDFAYDMDTDNARVGDAFMNQIQSIAAYVPYMTSVGNHEYAYNFSNYVNRFSMPSADGKSFGGDNNHYYSINIGPVHLISFSSEFYYFIEYGFSQVYHQYEWLINDLKTANLPENRAKRPWIITMAHRPMYCTDDDNDDCTTINDRIRVGFPFVKTFGLEDVFYKYGVDVELWAHEHSYERFWPLYDYKVYNGSDEAPYTNPGAPIHIITGSAGCQEKHDPWLPFKNITAFRSDDYGYTRMRAYNATHLYMEQVSDDQGGKIIDSFWIIKDKHGYF